MNEFKLQNFPTLKKYLGDNYLGVDSQLKARDLLKICVELKITLFDVKFNDDSLSGVIFKNTSSDTFDILVNATDPPKRKLFTLAHELAHYFSYLDKGLSYETLHSKGLIEDTSIIFSDGFEKPILLDKKTKLMEAEANFIASNLLMPVSLLKASVLEKKNIEEMAEEFGVPESALAFRLVELGMIPMEGFGVS